jgi:predicted nucleic acid-binding protein
MVAALLKAARYLIDTNILVYAHDGAEREKQARAVEVLGRVGSGPTGALPAQALAELASVALRKLNPTMPPGLLYRQVEAFERAFPVLPLTPAVVLEAVRAVRDHALSYHDAQIWAVAKLAQIPVVLSEDFASGACLEGVTFVDPFASDFDVSSL